MVHPYNPSTAKEEEDVARFRLAKNCITFETVSENTKMFFNQSTFTENSTSTIYKSKEPKDLNHDSLHNKSDSFWSLIRGNRPVTPMNQSSCSPQSATLEHLGQGQNLFVEANV